MSNDGWIKFHRKVLSNEIFLHDHNAWHVFEVLLLLVDSSTGSLTMGRFQLAKWADLKPITAYKALKRLENHKMVTLYSNNKFTRITVTNWKEYQSGNNNDNNTVTTREQRGNTLQELRSKKYSSAESILPEDISRIAAKYSVPEKTVRLKLAQVEGWAKASTVKDWNKTLQGWIAKDIQAGTIVPQTFTSGTVAYD